MGNLTKLKNLLVTRVDLVDQGANPDSHIMLFKRNNEGGDITEKINKYTRGSLDWVRMEIERIIEAETGNWPWVKELFLSAAIVEMSDVLWAYPWAFDVDGGIVLGTPFEVDLAYITKAKKGAVNLEELLKLIKGLTPEEQGKIKAEFEKIQKVTTDKEAEVTKQNTRITELEGEVETLKKAKEEPVTEDIWKGVSPALKEMFEKQQKEADEAKNVVKRLQEEAISKEFVAKAKAFDKLPIDAEKLSTVLKAVSALGPEKYAEVETVLKAAQEAIEKSKLFDEIGSGTGTEASEAWAKIEQMANGLVAKDVSMTNEKAVAKVMSENPELYQQYLDEMKEVK